VRRAAITGLGIVSPIGLGREAFRASLAAGRSGVHPFRLFDTSTMPVKFGGEIEEFDPHAYLDRKERKQLKLMPRTVQLGVAAARLALADARLDAGGIDPERLGIEMGTGVVPGEITDLGPPGRVCLDEASGGIDLAKWGREGIPLMPPTWMLNHVPNMPASHAAILIDARGPNNTVTQYDAAGLYAAGEAFRILQHCRADAMLAGGTDTRTAIVNVLRHAMYFPLSRREDDPETACRPFDVARDGEVLAEGAGVMLMEEMDHARRRGARVLAEVAGFATAFDARLDGSGVVRAINGAMREAGASPGDIDHVNAHAGGSADDAREARALHEALPGVPVLALKGVMGNAGNGASVIELAASVLALAGDPLPPTRNFESAEWPVAVSRRPRMAERPFAVKVALTGRGQCAALVLRRGSSDD
jgi:3-oxoacyl-[acyl-carrier-protein] synthase II